MESKEIYKKLDKKIIKDPVLYAEDHNLIIVLFDLKKKFVEYDSRSNYLNTLKKIIELKRELNNLSVEGFFEYLEYLRKGKYIDVLMNLLEKTIHYKLYSENIFNFINVDVSGLNPHKQFIFFNQFTKNNIKYRVVCLDALMIFLTLHQEKYGNEHNLKIFFFDSIDDYDLSSIPFEIRIMVNYSYLLSILKNIKIPFPYVFLNPSVYLPRKSYPLFIDIINEINFSKMNKILIIHA